MKQRLLDPGDAAARTALAARPPAALEHVLEQAAAYRKCLAARHDTALPSLPETPHPVPAR